GAHERPGAAGARDPRTDCELDPSGRAAGALRRRLAQGDVDRRSGRPRRRRHGAAGKYFRVLPAAGRSRQSARRVSRHRLHAVVHPGVHHHGPRRRRRIFVSFAPSTLLLFGGLAAAALAAFMTVIWGLGPLADFVRTKWRAYETWANGNLRSLYSPM